MNDIKVIFWDRILPFSGLFILSVVIYKIGVNNILHAFIDIKFNYLTFLPVLIAAMFITQTMKWYSILKHQNIIVEFRELFKLTLIGFFYSSITPGRLGGFVRIKYLSDYCNKTVSECSNSVIIDKVIDLIVLCCFASTGTIIIISSPDIRMALIALSFTIFLIVTSFIFYNKNRAEKILFFLIPKKIQLKIKKSFDLFYEHMPNKKYLFFPLLLTIFTWLLIYSQIFIIARSLSIEIFYFVFIFIISIGSFIALIPITINGIGTKEVTLIVIFSIYGVPPEKIIAMSLIVLLLCNYIPAFIGALLKLGLAKKEWCL